MRKWILFHSASLVRIKTYFVDMQSFINYAILIFLQIFEFHKNVKLHTHKKNNYISKKTQCPKLFFF